MTSHVVRATEPERETDRLSRRFADVCAGLGDGADIFAPDVFLDLNMPVWRFQLRGPEAWAAQVRELTHGPIHIDVTRTVATESGFVTEHEEHQLVDGSDLSARRLWLCDVSDGRIVEATCFCTGEWDEALRARHQMEAPMLRSWGWAK